MKTQWKNNDFNFLMILTIPTWYKILVEKKSINKNNNKTAISVIKKSY